MRKLLDKLSEIECFFRNHNWVYNDNSEYLSIENFDKLRKFFVNQSEMVLSTKSRFCKRCHRKENKIIVNFGKNYIWVETDKYELCESRIIQLKKIIGYEHKAW